MSVKQVELTDWVFTDPHYNHKKLVEKGYRPEGYEARIQASWLENVKPTDTVYCLGDVAMGKVAESHATFIKPMPGIKVLIPGNHDKQKDAWYLSHGWDDVHHNLNLVASIKGRHTRVLLSHIPQADDGSFDVNVHGHFHDDLHRAGTPEMIAILNRKHLLLAIERTDYQFVRLADFILRTQSA